jgi:integrase/recombinase XerD
MNDSYPIGPFVRRFLTEYVIIDRNLSRNTQKSYRDTIRLLFLFFREIYGIEPVDLAAEQVTAEVVRAFLAHLEAQRGNSVATRNLRLAAIHSLFLFISRSVPELVDLAAQVKDVPLRRSPIPSIPYLEKEEIDALLGAPDRQTSQGRRDHALLLFLYNTGARADEAARVSVGDLSFGPSPSVRILGKGQKVLFCPLWTHTMEVLRELLGARIDGPRDARVFLNVRKNSMTRFGIHTMVARNVETAASKMPSLLEKRVSPHSIRHSTAVHLLRSGVDINTIRAWLGHVLLETTNRYAEVDLEMKAKALAACAVENRGKSGRKAKWREDPELMEFLTTL